MKRLKILYLLPILLILPVMINAQSHSFSEKFELSFEAGHTMNVSLIDRVGSLKTYESYLHSTDNSFNQDYGFTQKDIFLSRSNSVPLNGKFTYRPKGMKPGFLNGTAYHLEFSTFSSSGKVSGRVESDPPDVEAGQGPDGTVRFISMWDANILPLWNDYHPSGLTPITYHANDKFNRHTADIRVDQSIANVEGYYFSANFGFKGVFMEYSLDKGQEHHAMADLNPEWDFSNEVSLLTQSRSEIKMAGPSVGLNLRKTLDKHCLFILGLHGEWSLLHSWGKYQGLFTDVDDIQWLNNDNPSFFELLDGEVRFSESRRDFISTMDLKITLGINFDPVEIGVGASYSGIKNLPLAPTFHAPWALADGNKAPAGLEWQNHERNTNTFGVLGYLKVRF